MTSKLNQYVVLARWVWPSTTYYYATRNVTIGGHAYEGVIDDVGGLTHIYIDSSGADFREVSLRLVNLAADGSANFPVQALDSVDDFEDKQLTVEIYDEIAGAVKYRWTGYTKRPDYDPDAYAATITATFILDAQEIEVPARKTVKLCASRFSGNSYETNAFTVLDPACPYATFGTPGFTTCNKSLDNCTERGMARFFLGTTHIAPEQNGSKNLAARDKVRDGVFPLIWCNDVAKFKPEVLSARFIKEELFVWFLISGIHLGHAFDSSDLDADSVFLAANIRATEIRFLEGQAPGSLPQEIPGNRNFFPEKSGKTGVAMCSARFALTREQADSFKDEVAYHAISVYMKGRKILRSGGRTSNLVYILEDLYADPIFGPAMPAGAMDSTAIVNAANYNSTRFHGRVELDQAESLMDVTKRFLYNFHGYVSFSDDGLFQINCKRDDETAVATFGSGGGIYIDKLAVKVAEEPFSDTLNELSITYRDLNRKRTVVTYYDSGAQIKAGNGIRKAVSEERFFYHHDDDEAKICAAVTLREALNLNVPIEFKVDLSDWLDSAARVGKVVRVNSPHIYNNASNYLFRVEGAEIDWPNKSVGVKARLYKPQVYAYNGDFLGGDITRGGGDTSVPGKPPDVESVDLVQISFLADDDNPMARLRATWLYPDLSAQMAVDEGHGVNPQYPIQSVAIYARFEDQPLNTLEEVGRVEYPTTELEFSWPFEKSAIVEAWFVPIGINNGQGTLGYITDPHKVTYLTADVVAADTSFPVADSSVFTPGDYYRIEDEVGTVDTAAGPTMTPDLDTGARATLFGSTAGDYPEDSEIGVAHKSHPTATVDLSTRRFDYPVVTGVTIRSRRRGIFIEWDDIDRHTLEWYLLYYSTSPTTELDTTHPTSTPVPSWYTADPRTPTAPVLLIRTKHVHRHISYERLGVAQGVPIYVRVAAQIKHNFSSALSQLATGVHSNGPLGPPRDPVAGDISQDIVEGSDRVAIKFTLHAGPSTETFDDREATAGGFKLEKYNKAGAAWSGVLEDLPASIEDTSLQTAIASRTFHRGSRWRIHRAYLKNDSKVHTHSTSVDLEFRPGTQTAEISTITDLQIRSFTDPSFPSIEVDPRHSKPNATWTQPATPVALKHGIWETKASASSDWIDMGTVPMLRDDYFQTTGFKECNKSVQHKKGVTNDFRFTLVTADGDRQTVTLLAHLATDESAGGDDPIDTSAHGPSFPFVSHIVRNHIVGEPDTGGVDFVYTPFMDGTSGDNDFGTPDTGFGPVRSVTLFIQERNAANTANVGKPKRFTVDTDLDKGTLAAPFEINCPGLDAFHNYQITELRYANSSDQISRISTNIDFVAGALSYAKDATLISGGSITYTQDDNRHSNTSISITQPTPAVLLESATYEVSYDNGTTWKHRKTRPLLNKASKYSVAGAAVTIPDTIQHRKNIAQMKVRVILTPAGGATYETGDTIAAPNKVLTSGAALVADDGYLSGDNPGTVAAAPVFKQASIGNAGLFAAYEKPADARPTLQYYEFQFADNSSGTLSTARDWLDVDDGSAAYTAVAPNADTANAVAVALVNATFQSASNRFTAGHLRKGDLAGTFRSNSTAGGGTLTLFVRARIVDLDDTGALRYGNWSTFGTVDFKSATDRSHTQPSRNRFVGRRNMLEGFGCFGAANGYPSPVVGATITTLGREFRYGAGGSAQLIATAAALGESGAPSSTSNHNIYWDIATRSIAVYGNSGTANKQIVTPVYGAIAQSAHGWLTFAIRALAGFTLPSVVVALWDDGVSSSRFSILISSAVLTTTYKLVAIPFNMSAAPTGNLTVRFAFSDWTTPTNPLFITHGCLTLGEEPRLWEPGAQEGAVNWATGVSRSDVGGLAALEANGGYGGDGITTWGFLDLSA